MALSSRLATGSAASSLGVKRVCGVQRPQTSRTHLKCHALLDFLKPKPKAAAKKPVRETVVLEPSFNLQAGLAVIAGLEGYQAYQSGGFSGWIPVAAFTAFLAAFLTFQATRLSFVFDDEALEIKKAGEDTDNVIVGGRNRWPYESFINWEFWWPAFPVLVYYKEDQTKPEGQVHFFPIIFNGKQLYEVMKERCGPSQNSV